MHVVVHFCHINFFHSFLSVFAIEIRYLYLSAASHINCNIARCLISVYISHGMCHYQVMMTLHFLNDVANDTESTQNSIISP